MDMQNKEILFEIVSSGNLRKDVQKLRELGYVRAPGGPHGKRGHYLPLHSIQ